MDLLLAAALYICAAYCIFKIISTFFAFLTNSGHTLPQYVKTKRLGKLSTTEKEYLATFNSYYKVLPKKYKQVFEVRVLYFINHNRFIARGYTHINSEMQILIASAAVQLTFGFPKMHFPHFWRILIYPDDYYSKISQKHHQGEVNAKGLIVLSWRNILHGFKEAADGRNLALHEMTHALHLENTIANAEHGFLNKRDWQNFEQLAFTEMQKIKRGQSYLFRAYAQVNFHEFFAVAVEHFFERANYFKKEAPELYSSMVKVLRQDPQMWRNA